jgi:N-acetylmuramoyl-L-alanine amidase
VHSRAIKITKAIDRGIQRARFSVLCTITRPAILFEGGFVSNPEEGRLISTDSYREKLANSIYEGIVAYIRTVGNGNGLKARNTRTMGSGSVQGGSSIHGGSTYRGTTRL